MLQVLADVEGHKLLAIDGEPRRRELEVEAVRRTRRRANSPDREFRHPV